MPILEMSAELLDLDPSQSWTKCNQNTFFKKSVELLSFTLQFLKSACFHVYRFPQMAKRYLKTELFFLLQMLTKVVTKIMFFIVNKVNKGTFVYCQESEKQYAKLYQPWFFFL